MRHTGINSEEIARLAGVSRSTVSRVINNYSNVPAKTREKVMKIIEQYQYVPNLSAQVLAGKKTRTIGLFMIEAGHVSSDMLTNMLLASIIENASAAGYYVLTYIIRSTKDASGIREIKDIFYQRRIDGAIFIGAANDEPLIEDLIAEGYIVGVMDQDLPGRDEPNRVIVNFDNHHGMMLAVGYLAQLNHREIGIVNGDMNRFSGTDKYEGFLLAMKHYGIPVEKRWVLSGGFHEQRGYEAIRAYLETGERLPTAMIMANDSVAFGAVRALRERGLSVPENLSIVGFDDHALSARFQPALTTVKVDFDGMMKRLTQAVIGRIEGEASAQIDRASASRLVVRDSCRSL
ncbi:LacI family DNA-binding transcriptional regulator [Cohnella lubricantis]|uniref:LacI family DNA-binding transcriptional regulator n=1 Tax=Cohnella lubricantis TaxID=2163172 RepID=A0A841TCA2_9BACL|nr:LacI family DNA-binding transcriptional regulator [Cohnella lubricantis]MBB6678642.1 LacI family DNA-binding transcriptional regulator [Cohnella lubricantis]MBP2119198.1 LacI family transcriptional regulator [Cohnella lubricantis]